MPDNLHQPDNDKSESSYKHLLGGTAVLFKNNPQPIYTASLRLENIPLTVLLHKLHPSPSFVQVNPLLQHPKLEFNNT
uniref:Uncharacterized protein n=1 Tax=Anopheles quadriannulatus TaxID=34691 RepID=A0A182XU25_ANOQN